MEQASEALAIMDYAACEQLCVQALGEARLIQDWAYYARILLPLQETRRQRRMIAAEGTIRLGTSNLQGDVGQWLSDINEGCIVLTHPYQTGDAQRLAQLVLNEIYHIEILFADCNATESSWQLTSFTGRPVICELAPPAPALRDRWLGNQPAAAQWFLHASEKLGDAAIDSVFHQMDANNQDLASPKDVVAALEEALTSVPDHEILHQRLAEAARKACLEEA
jgi:hypothetical protein